jgi:pyridoxal phosphate enzyme (YggS family)
VNDVAENLARVRARIASAAAASARAPDSIRLLAVSKKKSAGDIRAAYAAGQRDFGENYVQELTAKADALSGLEGLRWHAIGALQRNKVRDVARVASVIHAIDRLELAAELRRRAEAAGRAVEALVEVSVAGEEQKAGCAPGDARAIVEALSGGPWVRVVGLMAVPPLAEDPEASRPHFRALRSLRDDLRAQGHDGVVELSMGMSGDFEIAIAEGATMVRVGTAIFGARPAPR